MSDLYEEDIVTWSERQAELLRSEVDQYIAGVKAA